jgi:hypothetical protein
MLVTVITEICIQTHQQGRFHWVTACACDSPPSKEDGCGDGSANEDGVDIADFRKGSDTPEEVYGGGDDRRRADEEANLYRC